MTETEAQSKLPIHLRRSETFARKVDAAKRDRTLVAHWDSDAARSLLKKLDAYRALCLEICDAYAELAPDDMKRGRAPAVAQKDLVVGAVVEIAEKHADVYNGSVDTNNLTVELVQNKYALVVDDQGRRAMLPIKHLAR